jgi:nucleoside-diphosphate-sugar epimerase
MRLAPCAAARASGARIVFPGTVYNFGPDAFPSLTEASPQSPLTRKGAIRVGMEQALLQASKEGVKVLIVRAGDFFGPKPGNNWLSQGLVKPGKPIAAVSYPGPLAIPHAWAYLPDVAETMVRLATNGDSLADFEVFHMRGQALTGEALVEALSEAAGRRLAVHRLPWIAVKAMSPFNETMREMLEMRYLWERPVLLDNAKLLARLGEEPRTPIVTALKAALAGMAALPRPAMKLAA